MKSFFKRLLYSSADRLGFLLLPKWRLHSYELAQVLSTIFAKHQIDCVFDVGANRGQYGQFLRLEVGYTGLIVSVEPIPELYEQVSRMAETYGNWITYNFALGAARGRLPLNVMASSDFSSFLTPIHTITDFDHKNTISKTVEVELTTLDDLYGRVRDERGVRSCYLKLDTQGFDLEVLKGASNSLSSIPAMQSEISVIPIYEQMPDYIESLKTFSSAGFEVAGLFPVSRDANLRVIEFDCVMVHTPRK